mmetsp:Transcript_44570/g.105634  ORF Transcript_44570/g.105634 Transcript_44570/m.105634 type:complete len:277 (-) Transcript_44570:131-961(-)|eukprot:CAMPEP_0178387210 /NCGR_PEP_ID=MMETSP0689_2-20121128/8957_1 /TAXON_ID=160604 /ORGANISM="Amphidinium massartii, Strain CS-259" /LENGTH=276 /DNA_ID=CAMNT_0020007569 /DNA_START=93 /DNA_END=923 /DNA_ORIENTATION=+
MMAPMGIPYSHFQQEHVHTPAAAYNMQQCQPWHPTTAAPPGVLLAVPPPSDPCPYCQPQYMPAAPPAAVVAPSPMPHETQQLSYAVPMPMQSHMMVHVQSHHPPPMQTLQPAPCQCHHPYNQMVVPQVACPVMPAPSPLQLPPLLPPPPAAPPACVELQSQHQLQQLQQTPETSSCKDSGDGFVASVEQTPPPPAASRRRRRGGRSQRQGSSEGSTVAPDELCTEKEQSSSAGSSSSAKSGAAEDSNVARARVMKALAHTGNVALERAAALSQNQA